MFAHSMRLLHRRPRLAGAPQIDMAEAVIGTSMHQDVQPVDKNMWFALVPHSLKLYYEPCTTGERIVEDGSGTRK
jgi:hypothetical protein